MVATGRQESKAATNPVAARLARDYGSARGRTETGGDLMIHRPGRRVSMVFAVVLVGSLAAAAVALAASFPKPVPSSPGNGKSVHAGRIVLKVKVHLPASLPRSERHVFVAIGPTRKAVSREILDKPAPKGCNERCTFVELHQTKPGVFTYKSQFSFPGIWNETPGKYFWQAQYTAPLCQAPHCEVIGPMHSFRVVR
jgi:hypothetical protein